MRADIRLLLKSNPDRIFTRDGNKVKVIDCYQGVNRNLIYGRVFIDNKEIPHFWQKDGKFHNFKYSPLDLMVKHDLHIQN